MKSCRIAMLFGVCLASSSVAMASTVAFKTVAGSDTDGSLAATITFTPVAGGLEITVENTMSGTIKKGQAISGLSFTAGSVALPTSFTEMSGKSYNPASGTAWTAANGTAFDDLPATGKPNLIDHWGFAVSSSAVTLATAASPTGTGNPHYMILPSAGTAGPGNSLSNSNFYPFAVGATNFFLAVSGMTTSSDLDGQISNLKVSFGTGPDKTLATQLVPGTGGHPSPVPLPASVSTGTVALGALGAARWASSRRRK